MEARKLNSDITTHPLADVPPVSMDDYNLWKNFKTGDVSAYASIYRKYFFVLYQYGKKICSDGDLVKDCIQDLFIKIWNNRDNLGDTTSVRYYLLTSLKHKLLDVLEAPHQRLKVKMSPSEVEVADDNTSTLESLHPQKEKVLRAINKLSKHQQKVIELKFYKNQSNQEIAAELGITIQSVYNSVFKTLRSIRKQLLAVTLLFISSFLS